ncbi:hypothetical protein M422DRAFT_264313 [Sphaerobolus stellatus SS14]|uniref:Uncharacterized protein n=1 Tax=Sphaerobolus stellatus (strain SS14) TaxID=990650 RepID=A0A0C9V8N8_SPHS4|nr:hypothetical protein M422DRAFT_264313 [Sphaerobolus stellatus SS14]
MSLAINQPVSSILPLDIPADVLDSLMLQEDSMLVAFIWDFKFIKGYCHRKYSINNLLFKFFNNPYTFRVMMAKTGSFISGPQALQFTEGISWSGSDLDVYTNGSGVAPLFGFLYRQDYQYIRTSYGRKAPDSIYREYMPHRNNGLETVSTFTKIVEVKVPFDPVADNKLLPDTWILLESEVRESCRLDVELVHSEDDGNNINVSSYGMPDQEMCHALEIPVTDDIIADNNSESIHSAGSSIVHLDVDETVFVIRKEGDQLFKVFKHKLVVQIMGARTNAISVILDFHSTLVMNIITCDNFISLYPKATFEHNQGLILDRSPNEDSPARKGIAKYRSRGYDMSFGIGDASVAVFGTRTRRIGDPHTWVLPLKPVIRHEVIYRAWDINNAMTNTWDLVPADSVNPSFRVMFETFSSRILRWNYAISPTILPMMILFEEEIRNKVYLSLSPKACNGFDLAASNIADDRAFWARLDDYIYDHMIITMDCLW